jgi:hypothetical protein
MKKLFITSVFILFVSSSVLQAQVSLSLGVQGGLNIANVNSSLNSNTSAKTGMTLGTNLGINGSRFGLELGVNYTTKGFSSTNTLNTQFADKLNYIEFPLIINWWLRTQTVGMGLYLRGGMFYGINVGASKDSTPVGGQTKNFDVSNLYGSSDYGLLLGGGVGVSLSKKMFLFLQSDYEIGLGNISKQNNMTISNNGIRIYLGVGTYLIQ